ncbi:MAG TPA: RDD family protein [Chitinophagaceae bacterium]|nr:RDD family protein [Chitinophagaceae bacterium]
MNEVGIGTRVINFIVDTLLILGASYGLYKFWSFYVLYYHYTYLAFWVFFWGFMFIYYLFFESIWARTPGKWLTYTKAVNSKGSKPGFIAILIRSLVRLTIIDCFFFPFLKERTLHDYLSKTQVVEG